MGIGEAGVDGGARLLALHAVEAEDAGEVVPGGFALFGGFAEPEEFGFAAGAFEGERPGVLAAVLGIVHERDAVLELDRIQVAELGLLGAADPARRLDRAGDGDQAAGFFGDPFFDELDLGRVELRPIGIEGDDAIVLVELFGRAREVVEDRVRVLRDAGLSGLQEDVDDHRVVAVELVAQELVVAHRTARRRAAREFCGRRLRLRLRVRCRGGCRRRAAL